jgi:hypothetical protein
MAVTLSLFAGAGAQFLDNNGVMLSGGLIYTYVAGTTTPLAAYTSSTGNIALANPIVLDASGRVPTGQIWLTYGQGYKFIVKTSTGTLIGTYDNIPSADLPPLVNNAASISYEQGATVTAGNFTIGETYLINFIGTTNFQSIGAVSNTVGIYFTATGVGSGTGTAQVSRTVQAKLQESVSVKDFGAVGDGITDDTEAIQAAIDSGKSIFFPEASYMASGLTVSTPGQVLYATGNTQIFKNAAGTLITVSASFVEFNGLIFDGSNYAGDNIVATGNNFRLINCASRFAADRAVLATGSRTQIVGTNNIYQTRDTTATGYDIELGLSGTATLYHVITGIYTSQATGGILMVSTGTAAITSSQFGKLTLEAGGSPTGSGAPAVIGNRIIGDVTINQSGGRYSSNSFGANITVTSDGAFGFFGVDNALVVGATVTGTISNATLNPTQRLTSQRSGLAASVNVFNQASDNVTKFGDDNSTYSIIAAGGSGFFFNVTGSTLAQLYSGGFRPQADGTLNLGTAAQRWDTVFATTGTINTSDARLKEDVCDLKLAERNVALKCKSLIKSYRFKDGKRVHIGILAQELEAAFASEGLDAHDYGLFCYDEWKTQPAQLDDEGNVLVPGIDAGDRYGVRYEELFMFILGAM